MPYSTKWVLTDHQVAVAAKYVVTAYLRELHGDEAEPEPVALQAAIESLRWQGEHGRAEAH